MEERKFCQCCAMPLDKPEDKGTEADGSLSGDYCHYCYQNGALGPREEAEKMMRGWFPTLKRWKK